MEPNGEKQSAGEWPDIEERRQRLDQKIRETRSRISQLAEEVNAHRTRIAMAMGFGVFVMLLGAGAAYDLMSGKAAVWAAIGISDSAFPWIAALLVGSAILSFGYAAVRMRSAERQREADLEDLEQRYADLLEEREHTQALSHSSE